MWLIVRDVLNGFVSASLRLFAMQPNAQHPGCAKSMGSWESICGAQGPEGVNGVACHVAAAAHPMQLNMDQTDMATVLRIGSRNAAAGTCEGEHDPK